MEFPVGEFSSSSSSPSNPSLWSQRRGGGGGRPAAGPPLAAPATNGENGFLAAGFHPPPPVVHAFSIRTRLSTRLRVCGEQLADCWARLLARRPRRVYGTQAEMYASATAPPRDHQEAVGGGPVAAAGSVGGGGGSNCSSDSPPYLPVEEGPSYRHHRQPTPPSRQHFRDLAV
jgi:hypothetical protein